jgi:hypothetical protein
MLRHDAASFTRHLSVSIHIDPQAAFCTRYTDDSLVAVTVFRKWLAQPPPERAKWCIENCVFGKAMRAAELAVGELRTQLQGEGLKVRGS